MHHGGRDNSIYLNRTPPMFMRALHLDIWHKSGISIHFWHNVRMRSTKVERQTLMIIDREWVHCLVGHIREELILGIAIPLNPIISCSWVCLVLCLNYERESWRFSTPARVDQNNRFLWSSLIFIINWVLALSSLMLMPNLRLWKRWPSTWLSNGRDLALWCRWLHVDGTSSFPGTHRR